MEPIVSFQGLATGINFRDLVDQIVAVESRPISLMQQKQLDLDRETAAWTDFRTRLQALDARATSVSDVLSFRTYTTGISGDTNAVSATAGSEASTGSFAVEVLQLATHEKLGSDTFASRTTALGFSGQFLVGGRAVSVSATDTLNDVAGAINAVDIGSGASGVTATIVGTAANGYRLVLTADASGATGVDLADGGAGVLASLGLVDGITSIKHQTSDGALSDGLTSSATAVGSLRGLATAPSGTVTIGGFAVAIDLASDSLDDIASAINTAAAGAGSAVTAQVVSETDSKGNTVKRLDVSGTTSFSDSGAVLETLGLVASGRSAVAQQVGGAAFTDGDAVTAATGSTLLVDIWGGGSAAGVQDGDTLTLSGRRGDGTTFSKAFAITGTTTYQDLVDALNSGTDGFGAGTRTATASIVNGALVVTDDVGGDSRLSLSIVSHNEGGGTLDFGAFSTTTAGRDREIVSGVDAEFEVDGAFYTRSKNTVKDVVEGVTLTLNQVSTGTSTIDIARDVDAIASSVEGFIKSFNAVSQFVVDQISGEDTALSGRSTLRTMRTRLRSALTTTIGSTVGDFTRLAEIGIEANRNGTYDIDSAKLRAAIAADPTSVERLFSEYGAGSSSTVRYVSAGSDIESGTYDVVVTAAATRAGITGTGFAGTYVDDATADTLTVTDLGTQAAYGVALSNGMTLAQVVDALNTAFQTETQRTLQSATALKSDAIGTDADAATTLDSLFDAGGTSLGVANGDIITISGTSNDGSSYFREWTITDVSTQTLGDLANQVAIALDGEASIEIQNGTIVATAGDAGPGVFTLSLSSDNTGGGSLSFGSVDVTEAGRGKASITASDDGGQLRLQHDDYGSAPGFTVGFTAGGTDGSASLGLAAATYNGTDVTGTIGGVAATGTGQLLKTGTVAGTGLSVLYTGGSTGSVGSLTYSRGIASELQRVSDALLNDESGSIQGIVDGIDTQREKIGDRIEAFETRLEVRTQNMIRRFAALEEAMSLAQQQMQWLQAQLGSLVNTGSLSSDR